jgi:hypothetical protein
VKLRAAAFVLLWILLPVRALFSAEATILPLLTNGPSAKMINVVILAEGFMASEETAFTNQAQIVLAKLLSTPPYSSYKTYFNGLALFVPSNQSGSDHPSRNSFRDTYFNSTFESYGTDRLLTIPPNDRDPAYANGVGKVMALLADYAPDYDMALLLVNDTTYGGSGGVPAVTSLNSASPEIAIHELGHSFAGLGDEYSAAFPGYPEIEEPNTTTQSNRNLIKWRNWILSTTPIPTPQPPSNTSWIGLFQGAHYHDTGWYRPKYDCRMRTLGVPFCSVCAEAITLSALGRVQFIQSQFPAETNIVLRPGSTQTFNIETLHPADHNLEVTWSVDGTVVSTPLTNSLELSSAGLSGGAHIIRTTVHDPTTLVRTDPNSILTTSRAWNLTVQSDLPPVLASISDGILTVNFNGSTPADLVLESSPDLTAWIPLTTNHTASSLQWSEPVDPSQPARFFRIRE